jgi:hypothetical protein
MEEDGKVEKQYAWCDEKDGRNWMTERRSMIDN